MSTSRSTKKRASTTSSTTSGGSTDTDSGGGKTKLRDRAEVRLVFDNEGAAKSFIAWWLDGGGDGGGNLDWDTVYEESDKWDKHRAQWLRIKGTGEPIDYPERRR